MITPDPDPELVARLRAAGCVFAEDEARLLADAAKGPAELAAMADRRVAGEPLEYVLGWAEFCGLRILVEPGVFVPRRRSELLARAAVERSTPGSILVDLCCGSGAVGAVVAATVEDVVVHAADIDPAAVRCARRNLDPARVHEGDLYDALPRSLRGGVDVLVANAPYVPTGHLSLMPADSREHEAKLAVAGGADGLDVVRRIVADAPRWLTTDGQLLVETSRAQASVVATEMRTSGLDPQVLAADELDATAVLGARR